ncbi:MAG: chromosome segregation protein SMC [Candidatus Lokiarchaeota archaeon]|nr:chromosome segregation protein SMC [Candidatus Harpocratesius repetitus]
MVFIKRMICAGFKSFRKRTIINFDKGFTAIVGANGSGKSNIIDAFSFVLGELSSKALRANNIRDLISNGGKGFEPSQTASVEIIFDNSDNGFTLNTPEVCILRKVNRKGQSVYKINGKRSTRKEIVNLLDLAGFVPNSSNMIMQGELFRLINMSSSERRELIEEIAGIASYNNKKQSAEEELAQVQTNLSQISLLLNELYNQLEQLEKEKQDAEKFLELESKEKVHKNALILTQIKKNKTDLQIMGQKRIKITNQIKIIKEQQNQIQNDISNIEKEIEDLLPKIKVLQDDELLKLTHQMKKTKDDITELNASIKYAKQSLSNFENERQKLFSKISQLEQNEMKILQEIDFLNTKKENINEKIQKNKEIINNFDEQLKKIDIDYIELKNSAKVIQNEIDQVKEYRAKINLDIKVNEEQIHNFKNQKSKLEKKIYEKLKEIEILKKTIKDLEKKRAEKLGLSGVQSFSKGNIEKKIEELEQLINQWQNDLRKLKPELLVKQQKVFELQSQLKLEKEFNRSDRIARILKELRNKSQINGIYGSIAELGTTDPKYQKALEMAIGSRFQYIVVDDQQTGEECIKFLKKHNLGRASFIPLQEIKYSPFSYKIPKNEKIFGRAVDLIEFNQKYYHAFEYIFGRIVIVKDIATARMLQIPAKRVTLEGDIVDGSNLMTGGKINRSSGFGFFNKQNNHDNLDNLKNELNQFQQHESQLTLQIRNAQNEISRLYKIKISGENKTKEIGEQIAISNAKIQQIQIDIHKDEQEIEKINIELKERQGQLNQKQNEYYEVSTKLDGLNSRLSEVQRKLESSEENKIKQELKKMESELSSLNQELNKIEIELTKKQTILNNTIRKNRMDAQTSIQEKNNQIEQIHLSLQQLSDRLNELKAKEAELSGKISLKSQKVAGLIKERNELTLKLSNKRTKLGALSNQIHPLNMELNTLEIKGDELEIKIQELHCQINPEVNVDSNLLEKLPDFHQKELNRIEKAKIDIGPVNLRAIDKYQTIYERFSELQQKNEQVIEEREAILAFIDSLEKEKLRVFMNTFNAINSNFGYVFTKLSPGGEAKLELESPESPFEGGIEILARPGEKKWCLTQAMSGGEKTLTIIALILGIQMHVPSPYYILDEIDAALDDVNAALVADMIKELSEKSQFIIITHRNVTMARVDHLLGVSNIEGVTSVLNLSIQKVIQQLNSNENADDSYEISQVA